MAARSWRSPTRSARSVQCVNLREGQGTTTVESKTNFFAGVAGRDATDSGGDATASRQADPGLGDADHQRAGQAGGEGNADANGAVGSQERERGIRRGAFPTRRVGDLSFRPAARLAFTNNAMEGMHEGSGFSRAEPAADHRERGACEAEAARGAAAHRLRRPVPFRPAFHGRACTRTPPLRARSRRRRP